MLNKTLSHLFHRKIEKLVLVFRYTTIPLPRSIPDQHSRLTSGPIKSISRFCSNNKMKNSCKQTQSMMEVT